MKLWLNWRAAVLGLLAGFAGCGKPADPPPARVAGRVTFQGRPLAGGLIVFVPDADKGAVGKMLSAEVQRDGHFELAGGAAVVPPGWYRVAVSDPPGSYDTGFPPQLRRPDRSDLEREVKPAHDHQFEFLIELTR